MSTIATVESLAGRNPATLAIAPSGISTGEVGDFLALLKPRVMSLVVFTALVGMVVTPSGVNPVIAAAALLVIAVGAGASGCLNMWWDADIDAMMTRTQSRPIPAGKVTRAEALAFGMILSFGAVLTLGLVSNWLAAALLALTIAFYILVYSIGLKRLTAQNIVIGGAAGALPPVIGQAAVTGSVHLDTLVLFAIIFVWTPPHFWALALVKSADYGRAGIPMLPNVAGPDATRFQILAYTLVLVPLGLVPSWLGFGGLAYTVIAAAFGAGMLGLALRVYRRREGAAGNRAAMELFGFSILYLLSLFAALLAEHGLGLFRALPGVADMTALAGLTALAGVSL